MKKDKIVFFDSKCGICDKFISYLDKKDKDDQLKFCSLFSSTAQKYLPEIEKYELIDSIVYFHRGEVFVKSQAISKIFETISGKNFISLTIKIFPRLISDFFYDVFAKYRYLIFGRVEECSIEKQNGKFIK